MSITSSEKGDKRDKMNTKVSTESVKENPITVESLDQTEMRQLFAEMRSEIEELKKREHRAFEDDEEYDVLDDYLEEPAVFFCFSQQFNIHADVRNGRESLPPLDFIRFKPLYRYYRKNQRGVDVISVSQCLIRSKSQAEWLRSHTQFTIKFFENLNDAQDVDTTLAEKMAEQSGRVGRMSDLAVIEKCKLTGVAVHADLLKLRRELIQTLAKADLRVKQAKKEKFFSANRDENGRIERDSIINKDENDQIDKEVY